VCDILVLPFTHTWIEYIQHISCTLLAPLLFVSSVPQSQHYCRNLGPTTA